MELAYVPTELVLGVNVDIYSIHRVFGIAKERERERQRVFGLENCLVYIYISTDYLQEFNRETAH